MKKAIATFACMVFSCIMYGQQLTPHWTTPLNYQMSMSVNSLVYIDGVEPNSDYLELGAFCDNDCRGSALPAGMVAGHMLYMLPINADANGDVITFRLYDHQLGQELECECTDTIIFLGDNILGPYPDFYPLHFVSPVQVQTQVVTLAAGWSWISLNVDITLEDLQAALVEALPGATSIKIYAQNGDNTSYLGNGRWRGTLTSLDLAQMYMIQTNASGDVSLDGSPVNPSDHPLTIVNGVNYFGFPLSSSMTLSDAFNGFATSGDKVLSQEGQSSYLGNNRWRGDVTSLEPGKGYIFLSESSEVRILVFPSNK